jgi:hypothetical protein
VSDRPDAELLAVAAAPARIAGDHHVALAVLEALQPMTAPDAARASSNSRDHA